MSKNHLSSLGWATLSIVTFALGWKLKPSDPARAEANGTSGISSANLVASVDQSPGRQRSGDRSETGGGEVERALGSAQIAAIGKRFRQATDPIESREAFAELIAGLTAENALEIREQIAHLNADDPNFRDFHYAWGKVGGVDAVLHGIETDKRDMGPTLAGWATADPSAALDWYRTLGKEGNKGANQEALKAALVHGLAIADPAAATDFVYALGDAKDKRAKEMMGIVMGKVIQTSSAQEAAQWATGLEAGDLRGHALWEAGRAGVRENPDAALTWAKNLASDDPNAGSLAYGIAMEMGARDGEKAADWLDSLGNDGVASAYGPLLGGWTKQDPRAASEYVLSMDPSESRDHAIGGMVYTHRWEDPAAAAEWATQLSSSEGREKVLTLAAEAYIRKDPAGAADWLPESGLPLKVQQRLVQGGKR